LVAHAPRTALRRRRFPLHIVQRGIGRNACFFADGDYRTYLRHLRAFSAEFGCSVHAYYLMTNHVRLLVTPHAVDSCALLMKKLGQCYLQRVNQRLGRRNTGSRVTRQTRSAYLTKSSLRIRPTKPWHSTRTRGWAELRAAYEDFEVVLLRPNEKNRV
jgi:REP element-mobilizing transposase RayT